MIILVESLNGTRFCASLASLIKVSDTCCVHHHCSMVSKFGVYMVYQFLNQQYRVALNSNWRGLNHQLLLRNKLQRWVSTSVDCKPYFSKLVAYTFQFASVIRRARLVFGLPGISLKFKEMSSIYDLLGFAWWVDESVYKIFKKREKPCSHSPYN